MRIVIGTTENSVIFADDRRLDLYGKEAFELISHLWLKTSWNQKYSYTFTWLGRPIIQHPEDLGRLQEAMFTLRPDIIIETGVTHCGSLIFYASLFKAMGIRGRVVGIDIEIRPHNRAAIEAHELPRGKQEWNGDNPRQAAHEFAARHPEFILEEPKWRFNESDLDRPITAWPGAWLRRVK